MRIVKIKNLQEVSDTYEGVRIDAGQYYTIQNESELSKFATNAKINSHLWATPAKILINDGDSDLEAAEGDKWLKGNQYKITETIAFAKPTHRTKNNATNSIVSVAANKSENIDLLILEERFVSGGVLLVENAELGDYIIAEVVDKDGVVLEDYRDILCENYPIVNTYVEKMWINPKGPTSLDTRPLTAKITAGLYLRIIYHAINAGNVRKVAINYDMQKALA